MISVHFCWILLLICLNVLATTPITNHLKIVVIGDSVDRLMVDDWCAHVNGNLFKDIGSVRTNSSSSTKLSSALRPHIGRVKSWEIRVCEVWQRNLYVTMISNKFGVKSHPPWHMPIRTMSGLEKELAHRVHTLSELFQLAFVPGLQLLDLVMGGPPDGVLVNSAFWDLSHPDPINARTEYNKSQWLQSWGANVTTFLSLIRHHYVSTTWFGWHTANEFQPYGATWNTNFALQLLREMNKMSESIAKEAGYDWIDFAKYKIDLRDVLHPSPPSLIQLCDNTISRVNASLAIR